MGSEEQSNVGFNEPWTPTPKLVQWNTMLVEGRAIPAFAVNGLGIQLSLTEMTISLMYANQHIAALILAPGVAKTMGQGLLEAVAAFETATGQTVKGLADFPSQDEASK